MHPGTLPDHPGAEVHAAFQLCSAHYIALQKKNITRKTSAINPVIMENLDDSHYPITNVMLSYSNHKLTPFAVSKDEIDTKEDTGKLMMHALYIHTAVYQKVPVGLKQH